MCSFIYSFSLIFHWYPWFLGLRLHIPRSSALNPAPADLLFAHFNKILGTPGSSLLGDITGRCVHTKCSAIRYVYTQIQVRFPCCRPELYQKGWCTLLFPIVLSHTEKSRLTFFLLWPWTMTYEFELVLHRVKFNQNATYLSQRPYSSKIIIQTHSEASRLWAIWIHDWHWHWQIDRYTNSADRVLYTATKISVKTEREQGNKT